MAVNLDDGGVDHGVFHVRIVRCRFEKPLKHVGFHPVTEADIDRVPLPEGGRQVAPGAPCSGDPQHRLHKQSVILPATAWVANLAQAMRFHLRPLGIGQSQTFHPELESHQAAAVNPESQQALERYGIKLNRGIPRSSAM
jgi:hypothetical protein